MPLAEAVRLGIRALTVTQNKTLTDRDLEVAVLDQKRERRKFRRVANGELRTILGRPDPPEGGRPMGTS
jgi:20S proteasome alpha/beta subunit